MVFQEFVYLPVFTYRLYAVAVANECLTKPSDIIGTVSVAQLVRTLGLRIRVNYKGIPSAKDEFMKAPQLKPHHIAFIIL